MQQFEGEPIFGRDRLLNTNHLQIQLGNLYDQSLAHAKKLQAGATEAERKVFDTEDQLLRDQIILDVLIARREGLPLPAGTKVSYRSHPGEEMHPYSQNLVTVSLPFYQDNMGHFLTEDAKRRLDQEALGSRPTRRGSQDPEFRPVEL